MREDLAREAMRWDSGKVSPHGWIDAPERTPCCHKCDRFRTCPKCRKIMIWYPKVARGKHVYCWVCSECEHKIPYPEFDDNLGDCPFCGSEDVKYYHSMPSPEICCQSCGIGFSAGLFGSGVSDESAHDTVVKAWKCRNEQDT